MIGYLYRLLKLLVNIYLYLACCLPINDGSIFTSQSKSILMIQRIYQLIKVNHCIQKGHGSKLHVISL